MKLKSFKNWKIANKILSILVLVLLPVAIILLYILPKMEEKMLEGKKEKLQSVVESACSTLKFYHDKAANGQLSQDEAKKMAADELNALRYAGAEYFFAYDFDGTVMALGSDPKLMGTNRITLKDAYGTELVREIVRIGKDEKEGFLTYYYPKLGEKEASPKLSFVKQYEGWGWVVGSGVYIDDVEKEISDFRTGMYIPLIGVILLSFLFVYVINLRIAKPVKKLSEAANRISEGDTSVRVNTDSEDEIGALGSAFNDMAGHIERQIDDIKLKSAAAERAAADAEEAQAQTKIQNDYLEKQTNIILAEMNKLANGDLTVEVHPENEKDSIGQLFLGFNMVVNNLRDMFSEINEAVHATASSANEISSSSEEMAAGAQEQSRQTTEIAGAVEEMSKTIIENAKNTNFAADKSREASDNAKKGTAKIEVTKKGMERIVKSTDDTGKIIGALAGKAEQIGEISQVIDDIADQTNLLALNAAIEAARAGEQGRGFAVVADEVRKLAERTTKATKEIAETIVSIQEGTKQADESMEMAEEAVHEGMKLTEEVAAALGEVLRVNQNVTDIVVQLAAATEEQSAASEEISKNIEGISAITQQSTMGVGQIAKAAEDLNRLTHNLQKLSSRFKL